MGTVKFYISKTGEVKIEVDGVVGESCKDITRIFEEKLGLVKDVEIKNEYYQVVDDMEITLNRGDKE